MITKTVRVDQNLESCYTALCPWTLGAKKCTHEVLYWWDFRSCCQIIFKSVVMLLPTGQNTGSHDGARTSGVPRWRNNERKAKENSSFTADFNKRRPQWRKLLSSQREKSACRAASKKLSSRTATCENQVTAEQNSTTRWKIFPGYINRLQTVQCNPCLRVCTRNFLSLLQESVYVSGCWNSLALDGSAVKTPPAILGELQYYCHLIAALKR